MNVTSSPHPGTIGADPLRPNLQYEFKKSLDNRKPGKCYRCRAHNDAPEVYIVNQYKVNRQKGDVPRDLWWCDVCLAAVFANAQPRDTERHIKEGEVDSDTAEPEVWSTI